MRATIFGRDYALPVGVPPVGLGNMMWPGAELALARAAQAANIPYILSTFSTTDLAEIADAAPDVGWFQLYVPRKMAVMEDLLARVRDAGYRVLVVTLDIPVGAKRNRELRCGLKLPFSMSAEMLWQCATHPAWSLATAAYSLRRGLPDFVNVKRYMEGEDSGLAAFITRFNMQGVTRERVAKIREIWDGPVVLKGVQCVADMRAAVELGMDGIIVSNHGGRQLDAAPAAAESLRAVPDEVRGALTVMADSGIRSGMDVVRAAALGAQMTFSGRSFYWGVGALGGRRCVASHRDFPRRNQPHAEAGWV